MNYKTQSATTFIHTSDLQLGMKRWYLEGDGQALFDNDRIEAIQRLGDLATEEDAEFIVVAGDVFDDNAVDPRVFGRACEAFRRLPVPVYLLPGNHDPLTVGSVYRRKEFADDESVVVLDDSIPREVRPGVEVVGAPWHSKTPSGDIVAAALTDLDPTEGIRIGVAHGQVTSRGATNSAGIFDLDRVSEAIRHGVIDYLAVGDTHSTMQIDEAGKVWFSGSIETTDFRKEGGKGESDSGNVLVVHVDKQGDAPEVTVKPVPIGKWTFDAIAMEINSRADIDVLCERLDAYPDKARTVVKYGLVGTLGVADYQYLQEQLAGRAPLFEVLYARERTMSLHLQPSEDDIANLSLGAVARAAVSDLAAHPDTEASQNALNLLFHLAKETA